jgi:putrescine transport system substrate-binding protein
VEVAYLVPDEGRDAVVRHARDPADAPHPEEAHAFIDFLLRPEVIADATNHVFYPNANPASNAFVDPEILEDPRSTPTSDARAAVPAARPRRPRGPRAHRLWTRVRSGQ